MSEGVPSPARGRGGLLSPGRQHWATWPVYEAAELGLRNFWYPVVWSRDLGRKPLGVRLLGEPVVLVRDRGSRTIHALHDRCPHRGVPLHLGSQQFPGTITCPYHGWTYRLDSGVMCAAITDGPDSPIAGKVAVRTYPVAERLGIVWVFVGDPAGAPGDPGAPDAPKAEPPPVEEDIPVELLDLPVTIEGRIQAGRQGNWRYAAENGFDEGHAKFLHRDALWTLLREMPVWSETEIVHSRDGRWLSRRQRAAHWRADFPGLGTWSQHRWWKLQRTGARPNASRRVDPVIASLDLPGMVSVRLPYVLRVAYPRAIHYEWAVPEDAGHHRYVQLMASFGGGALDRWRFRATYRAFTRWVFHGQFTGQDAWMVDVMDIPPERLYRPDASVIAWRKLVEAQHREGGVRP